MTKERRPAQEIYQIRVQGHLNGNWARWFGDLAIHPEAEGTTMLIGPVRDQAALYGLLIKMRDLGLALLLVRQVENDPQSADTAN